jgi:hypothetical protein
MEQQMCTVVANEREAPMLQQSCFKVAHDDQELQGILTLPKNPKGVVVFVHGSGSSRDSAHEQQVTEDFRRAGIATVLLDLLTDSTSASSHTASKMPRPRCANTHRPAIFRSDTSPRAPAPLQLS